MTRHRLEVADLFREHGDEYLATHGATAVQRKVLRHRPELSHGHAGRTRGSL